MIVSGCQKEHALVQAFFQVLQRFKLVITDAVAITTDIYTFAVFYLRQASTNVTPQYLSMSFD